MMRCADTQLFFQCRIELPDVERCRWGDFGASNHAASVFDEVNDSNLFNTMEAISAEAARRGLTDEILEAELAAYNAERREWNAPPGPSSCSMRPR